MPDPAANAAPAGRPDAVSELIGSPSGSDAATFSIRAWFSSTDAVAGAVITGTRSTLFTVMTVLVEPLKALLAVKVTV